MTSSKESSRAIKKQVLFAATAVLLICAYRLFLTATETGNWRGAWFSLAHVVIVAVGTVLAFWKDGRTLLSDRS